MMIQKNLNDQEYGLQDRLNIRKKKQNDLSKRDSIDNFKSFVSELFQGKDKREQEYQKNKKDK